MIAARRAVPVSLTTLSSICTSSRATVSGITLSPAGGASTLRRLTGRRMPPAPSTAYACASCSGVTDSP